MRKFTIKHSYTLEERVIIAISVDSETHKYIWSFSIYEEETKQIIYCSYSQRNWDIISNEKV